MSTIFFHRVSTFAWASLFTTVALSAALAQEPTSPLPSPTPPESAAAAAPSAPTPPPLGNPLVPSAAAAEPTTVLPPAPAPGTTYYEQRYNSAFDTVPNDLAGIVGRIDLMDSVRIGMQRDPRIRLGTEDTVLAEGALQTAGGQFDLRLTGNARHGGKATPRDPRNLRTQRDQRQGLKDAERGVALQRQQLANGTPVDPNNPVVINGSSTADVQIQQAILALIAQQAAMNGDQNTANAANALSAAAVQRQADALARLDAQLLKQIRDFKTTEVDRPIDNAYDLSAAKLFRNGIAATSGFTYAQTGNRPGDPPINRATLFFQLDIPLGKGLGVRDTGAAEIAAKYDLEASLLQLRHTVSDSVLQTALAYWQAVGSRERLKLLIRNARISGALVELTDELVKGGSLDIAPADLNETRTKQAQALFQVAQAELDLIRSVQMLGMSMGLDALEILRSPLPTESFPRVISRAELHALTRETMARVALDRRADLASNLQLEKSKKTLLEAARLQLRPQVGFQFKGLMESVNQGISFSHYGSAFAARYPGPGFVASLNLDWAPAQNAAKGNLLQQGAFVRQSVLRSYELSRAIASNVLLALASLDHSLREIEHADAEANFGREALEAARTKLRLGQVSVLDTIQVQERYIQALQDIVTARQLYAQSLVQLRFETATLLPTNRGAASLLVRDDLVTLPHGWQLEPTSTREVVAANTVLPPRQPATGKTTTTTTTKVSSSSTSSAQTRVSRK